MLLMFYTLHHLFANPHLKMIKLQIVLLMNFLPFAFKVKLFKVAFELLTTRCCTSRQVKSILASKPSAFYVLKYVYIIVCTMLRNCCNMLRNCFIILDLSKLGYRLFSTKNFNFKGDKSFSQPSIFKLISISKI